MTAHSPQGRAARSYIRQLALFLSLTLLLLSGCTAKAAADPAQSTVPQSSPAAYGDLSVSFLDVGQGDSILIASGGHFMLIDAGENDQGETVVSDLKEAGVETLDYVIGTHPHSDHIGGLDDVLHVFPAKAVILPPVSHTTAAFEDVLDAVAGQSLKLTKPVPGDSYELGGASFTILSPVKDYGDDLNNWSVGIRLVYGDNAFVLCGDAEEAAETDIAASGTPLSADVLKVGHHGSRTSTCDSFLKAVSPTWAVIQCGAGNSYGHPHPETLDKLEAAGVTVLRTDLEGTITAVSDGSTITWQTEGAGLSAPSQAAGTLASDASDADAEPSKDSVSAVSSYILNTNTKKFHLPSCPSVDRMNPENRAEFTGERSQLLQEGYSPCGQCSP